MAKYGYRFCGDFDTALDRLHDGILNGSVTVSCEEGSDYAAGGSRGMFLKIDTWSEESFLDKVREIAGDL